MCAAVLFSWSTVCYYVTILLTDSVIDEHGSFFQLLPFTDNDAMNPLAFSNPKSYQFHLVRLKKKEKEEQVEEPAWRASPVDFPSWPGPRTFRSIKSCALLQGTGRRRKKP